ELAVAECIDQHADVDAVRQRIPGSDARVLQLDGRRDAQQAVGRSSRRGPRRRRPCPLRSVPFELQREEADARGCARTRYHDLADAAETDVLEEEARRTRALSVPGRRRE